MGRQNKPSNKERDQAITQLYQYVQTLGRQVEFLGNSIANYIDFRKDGKRYKRWLEKQIAQEKKQIEKIENQQSKQKEGVK